MPTVQFRMFLSDISAVLDGGVNPVSLSLSLHLGRKQKSVLCCHPCQCTLLGEKRKGRPCFVSWMRRPVRAHQPVKYPHAISITGIRVSVTQGPSWPFSSSMKTQDFPVAQWLRLRLLMQRAQVQSLIRELRSHMPCGAAKKIKIN